MNENNNLKTPSYTLKAIKAYTQRNPELIKQRNHDKYSKLTDEKKQQYKLQRQHKIQTMTPEAKDAYKAKQRAYYQARKDKLKQQSLIEDKDKEDL